MSIFKLRDKATSSLKILTLIGIAVLLVRSLIWADKLHSSLLYIAIPFGLSLALYYLTPHTDGITWKKRFWNNLRVTMIIMLAASLILMEGYICVVVFLPIFFLVTLIAFIACYIFHRLKRGSLNAYALPAIVMLLSLEGVTDITTFNRHNQITYSQVIDGDIDTIKQKLSQPIILPNKRHWLLTVFPMPRYIGTVNLEKGAIRKYDFVYHRWFATNTHTGHLDVAFTEVSDTHIKTQITDSSYISNYMKIHGTEFSFAPINDEQTRVTLTVTFDRLLDPVWYFEPLQRFAVKKSAEHFVTEVLGKQSFDTQEGA